jgi:hypothetical protein
MNKSIGLYYSLQPNDVVEWLKLLLRIREVPGSNLGTQTGYPQFLFILFSPLWQI